MKTALIKIENPELNLLEKSKAEQIKETFNPMIEMLDSFESDYQNLITQSQKGMTKEISDKAKRIRLDIAKIRIQTGKIKDKQKEYIKLEDKAIMGVHNILIWAVKEKEDNLKKIEDYFEIKEKERLDKLQKERVEELSKYVENAEEIILSDMDVDVWEAFLQVKINKYNQKIEAEKEAERIAEEKRQKEIQEKQRIEAENKRLKAEAEEREKQIAIEKAKQEKIEAERKAKEEAEKNERERIQKIEDQKRLKIESERRAKEQEEKAKREEKERKEREAFELKLKAEREESERLQNIEKEKREKVEAELKAKQEAEEKAKKEAEEKIQSELNKGDAEKVKDLISDLESLKTKYSFKSEKNKKMYSDVSILIDKVKNHIKG